MIQDELRERRVIINKPNKRPYGVRVMFKIWTLGTVGNLEKVCLLTEAGLNLTISPTDKVPWEAGRPMQIELEGFASAADAESQGKKLALSLLWLAIRHGHALQLNYQTHEPVYVYERNRSSGWGGSGYADNIINQSEVINDLLTNYSELPDTNTKLFLSMEIFAASRLETSEKAKFLSMVSSLELLANRKQHGNEVKNHIKQILNELKCSKKINNEIKSSISSSIGNLKKESIGQSLKRFALENLPDFPNAAVVIEEAYKIRSQIIHSGRTKDSSVDLNEIMRELEKIIRAIYQKILDR